MPVTLERSEELSIIRFDGTVDIACAAELKSLLIQALASGKPVEVSLESATNLDVTALQLLWAAGREATASRIEFSLLNPVPAALTSALLHAGFEDLATTADAGQVTEVNPCRP